MAGVNKVILIGNLGRDPEVRTIPSGAKVASFSMATSETWTDKTTNEKREHTDWHNIVLWRGLAEIAERFLKKGSQVYIEGRLKTRSWQDNDGNTKYTTEVVGDNLTLLGRREGSGGPNIPPPTEEPLRPSSPAATPQPNISTETEANNPTTPKTDSTDSDESEDALPF